MEEKMYTFRYSYDELRVVQQTTDGDYGKVIRQEGTITVKGFSLQVLRLRSKLVY